MRKRFLFLAFGSFPFWECVPRVGLSDTDIWKHSLSDLKFTTRSVTLDIFNQLKKNVLPEKNAKGVVEGLGTGSFVTVTNLDPHLWLRENLFQ